MAIPRENRSVGDVYPYPYQDNDGDGVDDRTNLSYADFHRSSQNQRQTARQDYQRGNQGFRDADGDGRDDGTGLSEVRYNDTGAEQRDQLRTQRSQAEQDRREEEYLSSGQRQEDLDAGRGPMGADDPYADDSSGRASDFDEGSADVPIWGWLSGAQARRDAARQQSESDRMASTWEGLSNYMPSPDDLAVEYGEEAYIDSPENRGQYSEADPLSIAAMSRALGQLQDVADDGMTNADRARLQLARQEIGQQQRATREADQAALQARGMGGSGASIASMIGAQQGGAQALSQADYQMQIAAQQRALQAMQASGGLAGNIRGQSFDEDAYRNRQIDDWNRMNTEYRRGHERFNVGQRDKTGESRSRARQQGYENRERQAAGQTNQWAQGSAGARADAARQDQANQAAAGAIGSIIEEIL